MELIIIWAQIAEKIDPGTGKEFQKFVQKAANRQAFGRARYGKSNVLQKYMTRMELEMKAYKKTGNIEHLFNICNYAFLESYAPENKKSYLDDTVDSVTRGKI